MNNAAKPAPWIQREPGSSLDRLGRDWLVLRRESRADKHHRVEIFWLRNSNDNSHRHFCV
jgi:hypothetical protein